MCNHEHGFVEPSPKDHRTHTGGRLRILNGDAEKKLIILRKNAENNSYIYRVNKNGTLIYLEYFEHGLQAFL